MSNEYPRMLYKAGGPHKLSDGNFDYLIVDDAPGLALALGDGWALTTLDALEPRRNPVPVEDDAPPTRAEMEAKARELKLSFNARTSDANLAAKIAAALKA